MDKGNAVRRARAGLRAVTSLLLVALLVSCDDSTGIEEDVGPLLVSAEMGVLFQHVSVTRDGEAVTDALVKVHGERVPHVGSGHYEVILATRLSGGSPLRLRVNVGEASVWGTVDVPEPPVLIAPADETVFATTDSITIRWASETDPDRFGVQVGFREAEWWREVPGTAREIKVAVTELPESDYLVIHVTPYNDGQCTGLADPDSRVSIAGDAAAGGVIIDDEAAPLSIEARMEPQNQSVSVRRNLAPVRDAVVTVNGVAMPYVGDWGGGGAYEGELPAPVPAGSPLELRVSAGEANVEGTGSVPEAPALHTPVTGTEFFSTDSIAIRWTSRTDPDRFLVTAYPWWDRELPGTAREIKVTATEFPEGADLTISVIPYNDGELSGPAHPESRMGISGQAAKAQVSISEEAVVFSILTQALQDEYRMHFTYARVLSDLGDITPFLSVAPEENEHIARLSDLFTERGLDIPASDWSEDNVPRYATRAEACSAAVLGEEANIALYETLLAEEPPEKIATVFRGLQMGSGWFHLLPFRRCAAEPLLDFLADSILTPALQAEYRMSFTYARVLSDLGDITPFNGAVAEEAEHIATVSDLFTNRGLNVPPSDWSEDNVPTYPTRREACAAAVLGEEAIAELYGTLMAKLPAGEIFDAFGILQVRSGLFQWWSFRDCAAEPPPA